MNVSRTLTVLASLPMLALVTACGGGSSDSGVVVTPPPTGGIGRNGIAIGPISNFGSVIVNGVTYDTDSAQFVIDDAPGTQADLRVGDYILVDGTINDDGVTGVATTVFYDDLVKGPVASIDLAANTLVVLGQPVIVTAETSFDDDFPAAGLAGVSVGQIVEVSGLIDANDDIVATRIEPKPAGTQLEVHGTVAGLDAGTMQFTLRGLTVDYSQAMLEDFPGGVIADGDFVEAKGTALGAGGELIATEVELEAADREFEDGEGLEIEGFITRFASVTDFDVAGIAITTDGSTVFEGGTAADLGLNVKVEVEGSADANGVIVADKIEIRRAKAVRIAAAVDSVDAAGGTLTLLGIPVTVDALTRLEDKTDAEVDPLNLDDLSAGDYVEVRGSEDPGVSGTVEAALIERDDPETEVELRGFVTDIAEPAYTVLGVTIMTDANTVFRAEDDTLLSAAEFFGRLAAGDLVEAEGVESSATMIVADEVEFEDD